MLCASAQQFDDWSAAYRIFSRARFAAEPLFAPARKAVGQALGADQPLVALMDDTLIRKNGRKIHGTRWMRDPLGPRFQVNLVWGQRFIQLSAALPEADRLPCRARGIPIDLRLCPAAQKPSKGASEEEWKMFRQAQRQTKLSQRGAERLAALRQAMDGEQENRRRTLIAAVDGSYTNRAVLKQLPERTVLIGRIRKDAKLYELPAGQDQGRGRPRVYGPLASTPEQLRQDPAVPWQKIKVHAAGKIREFQIKTVAPLRWRGAGKRHNLRLVVVRPLAYRPGKNAKTLYRQPAYLICTDCDLSLEKILQYYVWRWEIEVNFRDEKTLIGAGQAQVRAPEAVEKAPQLVVAAYAYMLLAADLAPEKTKNNIQQPKWRKAKPNARFTTGQCISALRSQLWGLSIKQNNLKHFDKTRPKPTKSQKNKKAFHSAAIYATK